MDYSISDRPYCLVGKKQRTSYRMGMVGNYTTYSGTYFLNFC